MSLIYINSYQFASAPWTPANISTALWLDADDASTINESGGAVSQWDDKSGNNRHATQGTPTAQPTRTFNGLNSRTVLTFNGLSGGSLMSTTWSLSNSFSIFVVARKDTQTSDTGSSLRPLVCAASNDAGVGTFRTGLPSPYINAVDFYLGSGRVTITQGSWPDNQVRLLSNTYDGATIAGWVDGSSYSLPLSTTASGFGTVYIGGDASFDARRFAGSLAETVIISSAVNTLTRQKLEGYLAHKWGLAANLPAAHPYKSTAP